MSAREKLIRWVATALLAAALVLGPATASTAEAAPSVKLSVSPSKPVRGKTFSVAGALPTKVVRTVRLQVKTSGKWKTLKSGKTSKKGTFSFSVKTSKSSLTLRVVAPKKKSGGRSYAKTVGTQRVVKTIKPSYVRQIGVGDSHACALLADKTVKCWGANDSGQVGDGTRTDRLKPTAVKSIKGATAIAVSETHSCAIVKGGAVKCWGNNYQGALGDGTATDRSTPVTVRGIKGAKAISSRGAHTCALLKDKTVRCWGDNYGGKLGNGSTVDSRSPVKVKGLSDAVAVSAGYSHTCAVVADGAAKCWGANDWGELGDGSEVDRSTPVAVRGLKKGVVEISAGVQHTCAIAAKGAVKCWGYNGYRQLGVDLGGDNWRYTTTPTSVGVKGANKLVAAGAHSCAVLNGPVKCWGAADGFGVLGDGKDDGNPGPVRVAGLKDAVDIAAAAWQSCVVTKSGVAKCWGHNDRGQLGDGTRTDRGAPVRVKGIG